MLLLRTTTFVFVRSRAFSMATLSGSQPGPMETSIRQKLTTLLDPINLSIKNDSMAHQHHAAMKGLQKGGETHFSVEVVSEFFKGKNTLARHRVIHTALADEFAAGLHALSLKTKTPEEIQKA